MSNDLEFEKKFWGDCCNTFGEDLKHFVYGRLMGLEREYYSFNTYNKSILDIGGGPTSMLLKTFNLKKGLVIDPIQYPSWTVERYRCRNIDVKVMSGEDINETGWDEVWIYNCLQHTEDPEKIISNAKRSAKVLRFFEWINIPAHEGHPHQLTQSYLEKCIGQKGKTIYLSESECFGEAFYGCFDI